MPFSGKVGSLDGPHRNACKVRYQDPIMATLTITDLPSSRALDYEAMSAIRGAGLTGDWCLYAFRPFVPESDRTQPIVVYQTNIMADQLNLLTNNIAIQNSAPGAAINVSTISNALNVIDVGSTKPGS
jgi:hypothetical protein